MVREQLLSQQELHSKVGRDSFYRMWRNISEVSLKLINVLS
jgi:hypothetical protein